MKFVDIHRGVGLAIGAVFFLIAVWGLVAWIRNRDPGPGYWRLLAVGQGGLVFQVLVGAVMLIAVGNQPILHYVYGAFPFLVLLVAHRSSKHFKGLEWAAFSIASFFIFGLQIRGFMTGLGG